jgi:hypothetical protein
MATSSGTFEYDKEGSNTLNRNSPKSRQQDGSLGLDPVNGAVLTTNNGTGKSLKNHLDGLPEYIRSKSPLELPSKPHLLSEYDESDGPIYHQATGDRGVIYNHVSWNNNKDDSLSLKNIIGIQDVCGNKRLWRMLIAEFIGTLFLVLIGCGSCLKGWSPTYEPGMVQIALAFGLTVAAMAQVNL